MSREISLPGDLVLGFDARSMDAGQSWPDIRREEYLLRPEIAQPFSADSDVWPTAISQSEVPRWVGPCEPFWDSLERLESFLGECSSVQNRPYAVIALTLEADLDKPDDLSTWWDRRMAIPQGNGAFEYPQPASRRDLAQLLGITPSKRAVGWHLLGYDVADRWLLSGLSSCGYRAEERERLRARFGPQLNAGHLFADLKRANEFKLISAERVVEHAPFFVYGLWLLKENRGD
jgi:hypothetical protein